MNKYFTIVKNPKRVKPGDILVWKKETGKVPKLHLSASSMRSLGFSIGNRYRALSYDQVRKLTRNPEETRYYLIDKVSEASSSSQIADMSFCEDTTPVVRSANLVEFPMTFDDGPNWDTTPLRALVSCDDCSMGFLKTLPDFKFGLSSGTLLNTYHGVNASTVEPGNQHIDSSATIDGAIKALVTPTSEIFRYDNNDLRFSLPITDATEPGNVSSYEFLTIASKVIPESEHADSLTLYRYLFPAKALSEAVARGAVILRPTDVFWTYWASEASAYVKACCVVKYRDVMRRLATVTKVMSAGVKSVTERAKLLSKEIKTGEKTRASKAKGVINELGEA